LEPARISPFDFKSNAAAVTPLRLSKQKGKRLGFPSERKTRFELATFSLARRRATAAPLPQSSTSHKYSRTSFHCQANRAPGMSKFHIKKEPQRVSENPRTALVGTMVLSKPDRALKRDLCAVWFWPL